MQETDLPDEKKARFLRVWESLSEIPNAPLLDDETVSSLVSVSDEELERLIGRLPPKLRALYSFMHNRLMGRILARTGDRLSVAEELLQEEMDDENDRQAVLEQIVWSARLFLVFSRRRNASRRRETRRRTDSFVRFSRR